VGNTVPFEYARSGALSKITTGDTIRLIDILTADGWVHIQDGIVQ
jgi:hypothetical protein